MPKNSRVTHISLFDRSVEGLELTDCPAFSVQYHPESSPGPDDSFYLFEKFVEMMKKNQNGMFLKVFPIQTYTFSNMTLILTG